MPVTYSGAILIQAMNKNDITTQNTELMLMKRQLKDMIDNPSKYEAAMQGGFVAAGFGGDLNGIQVPTTLMSGRLPPGVTPQEALRQVIQFMAATIKEAEQAQKKLSERSTDGQVLGIEHSDKEI